MNGLTVNLGAVVSTALRGLLLFVLAAGATLGAQQRIASASVTVNVLPGLTATLEADPTTIASGGSSTLRWTTTGASSASLDPGDETIAVDDLASGSKTVSPTATTTYTLTASDGDDDTADVTASVTVTVTVLAIDSFAANDRSLETGERVTLSWRTTGADRVELQEDRSGDFTVISGASTSPDGRYRRTENTAVSRDFRLVAYAGTQSLISNTVGVTWRLPSDPDPPCEIDSFSANPSTITEGGSSSLRWRTTNGTGASIDPDVGKVTPVASGSTPVSPPETTTYELTCSGEGGNDTASVEVIVRPPPDPCEIDSFSANPSTITEGGSSELSWRTTDGTSVTLDGSAVAVDGSTVVSPPETTTYELTCHGAGGDDEASVTVTVEPPLDPCEIDSFSAFPSTISEGGSSELSWTTTDGTSVSIPGTSGELAVNGSATVSPTSTTAYKLTCRGAGGNDTASVTVTVNPRAPTASLDADPEEIFNPGDSATLTWSTTDATSASIDEGVGSVTPVADGSTTVYPDTTTTYTLTAPAPAAAPATRRRSTPLIFSGRSRRR